MTFRPHEIEFMRGAELGRLATAQPDGTLQNSPVGFTYNEALGTIDVSGYRMAHSQKFRNVAAHPGVAFVVDDIASHDPWRVRCLEIRGTAEQAGDPGAEIIRITPRKIIGFGIDAPDVDPHDLQVDSREV
jgi:pyridoxamine 5'-phosphate oxidase family protein